MASAALAPAPQPAKQSGGGFKSFLTHAMPFISAGLSLGGPLGAMAGNLLKASLGSSAQISSLPEAEAAYTSALTASGASADIVLKAQEAERSFQMQCEQMKLDSVQKILDLAVSDTANARAREIAVKDHTPEVGFYLLLILVAVTVASLMRFTVPPENKAVLFTIVGGIVSTFTLAAGYFYGTSRGSERKTEIMAAQGDPPAQ